MAALSLRWGAHIIGAPLLSVMPQGGDPSTPTPADTTGELVARAQDGDAAAMNDLFRRHVPELNRWARGRLPTWARDLTDTHDLVQDTVLQTFKRMGAFEWRGRRVPLHSGRQRVRL